jgi:hypothetical protein
MLCFSYVPRQLSKRPHLDEVPWCVHFNFTSSCHRFNHPKFGVSFPWTQSSPYSPLSRFGTSLLPAGEMCQFWGLSIGRLLASLFSLALVCLHACSPGGLLIFQVSTLVHFFFCWRIWRLRGYRILPLTIATVRS